MEEKKSSSEVDGGGSPTATSIKADSGDVSGKDSAESGCDSI